MSPPSQCPNTAPITDDIVAETTNQGTISVRAKDIAINNGSGGIQKNIASVNDTAINKKIAQSLLAAAIKRSDKPYSISIMAHYQH
jgi:hypothetical protein